MSANKRPGDPAAIPDAAPGAYVLIDPPAGLRARISLSQTAPGEDEAVRRAEAELAKLSHQFADWMEEELAALNTARATIQGGGISAPAREALFGVGHDIRGQAATLGYPNAGRVAASLCSLIEACPDAERLPLDLVNHHLDAIQAIVREHTAPRHSLAAQLATQIEHATQSFIREEHSASVDKPAD